jgi:hypothetical protein
MATKPDYYMVTREIDKTPNPWGWEIRRHSKPMPVKISGGGFRSQMAAEFAGNITKSQMRADSLGSVFSRPLRIRIAVIVDGAGTATAPRS